MFKDFKEDIAAFKKRDPAATSTLSVILNSPGMRAVWAHRRHHWLWNHGFKGLARLLSTWTRNRFGVEIHPAAQIGKRFMIDHGMGIVIGETTIIGDDCLLYQGVTLGGTGNETGKRHPTLGNNVLVGVNACVLGNITLGDNVKVGGGAVVVNDAPAGCTMVGVPAHGINCHGSLLNAEKTPIDNAQIKADVDELKDVINKFQNIERKEFLPDPFKNIIMDLDERIGRLEEKLSQFNDNQ